MSARTLRRTFASPFVVTLAACTVQSAPPPQGPQPVAHHPGHGAPPENTAPSDPNGMPRSGAEQTTTQGPPVTVMANPPPPSVKAESYEAHWTVTRQGDKCQANVNVTCPKNATCNPPPPRAYACTPEITQTEPLKIVRWAGSETCQVEVPPMKCPPNASCNPPRPRQVACPQ